MVTSSILTSIPIFKNLDLPTIQALFAALEPKILSARSVLFSQGDPGEAFYIVTSGKLSVYERQSDGLEASISSLGAGECTGEMALLTGQPLSTTVIADENCELLRLTKTAFDRLAEEYPILITELANYLLPRFQQAQARQVLTRLFGHIDEAMLHDLQDKLEWRRLDCGQVLCRQGEPGDEMYIVVQGRLRFAVEEADGPRDLGEVGAGESVGEFALLAESGTPESLRSATVYATRLTDVVVLTRQIFESLLCQYPQALLKLTRRIVRRELLISQSALPPVSAQVITVVPTSPGLDMDEFGRQLADSLNSLGSTLFLDPGHFEQLYGKPGSSQTPLDHPTSLLINAWLDEREREHKYVLYAAFPALDESGQITPWAQRCVEDADILLLVGQGGGNPALTPLETALPAAQTRARLELVLLHPSSCQIPSGTADWLAPRCEGPFPIRNHHHVRLGNPADFRRLCRRISGRTVGLTLSGGGARGWAHVGVIRALEEANLEVDYVGGASMGAILAAGYALDWPSEHLHHLAAQFSDPKKLLDYTFPYASITSTPRITNMLQELIGEARIEDTWRPFFCVSANLTRGEEQLHTRGVLWKAVRASMAFPAIFAPISDQGCVLIDGGAANNLPIDRMREMCPTGTVIGVDLVTSSPTKGPYEFGPSLSGWQALRARLIPSAHSVKAPNLLDIVAGIVYNNNRYRLNEMRDCADLLIQVHVEAYGLLEFDKYAEIIELGYATAKEQIKGFKVKG
jgi:predicted acylesterase/phospholipase RssA/CRP-like cAMP-binding protein